MSNRDEEFSIDWKVTAEHLGNFFGGECEDADATALLKAAVLAYQKRGWQGWLERDINALVSGVSPMVGKTTFPAWSKGYPNLLLPGRPEATVDKTQEQEELVERQKMVDNWGGKSTGVVDVP